MTAINLQTLTYKQFLKAYPQKDVLIRHGEHIGYRVEVFNPTIKSVRPGQMVRVWSGEGRKTWGTLIAQVDIENNQVLVRDSIGGTRENARWVSVDMVQVVWGDMSYEEALKLIAGFNGAVCKALDKAELL